MLGVMRRRCTTGSDIENAIRLFVIGTPLSVPDDTTLLVHV
jgi:hypothetical protein